MSSAPHDSRPSRAARIVVTTCGALVSLVALGLVLAGVGLALLNALGRDDDGFFGSPTERFATPTHALTHEGVSIFDEARDHPIGIEPGNLATVRVRARSANGKPVFVGIAPARDVERYLEGVSRDLVDSVDYEPFRADYVRTEGGAPPTPPGEAGIWTTSASGVGEQEIEWELEDGTWSLVVMNADGSAGVATRLDFGADVRFLAPIAVGLLAAGIVLAIAGAAGVYFGLRGLTPPAAMAATGDRPVEPEAATVAEPEAAAWAAPVRSNAYPVAVEGELSPGLSRWLWLVKWVLVLPHLVVLAALWLGVAGVTVIAFFAVLFTGRYPRPLFDYVTGVLRWTWRVAFYSYGALATDRYPPFTLRVDADHPAHLDILYPESLSRGLVLVKWWLLAIPHYVVVAVFVGAGGVDGWPGLVAILALFAGAALLFTGRYPRDLFELVLGLNRWTFRVAAYALLLRDEYPPFRLRDDARDGAASA